MGATDGNIIAVTTGIVLTKGGCNSALAVGGGRESKPWLIPAGKLSTAHRAQRPPPPGRGWPPWVVGGGRQGAFQLLEYQMVKEGEQI